MKNQGAPSRADEETADDRRCTTTASATGSSGSYLVRHVASATALDEVLGIVDEFLPASEPSSLDRFGLRVIRFPDRARR